jgi:hypothetical protein
MMAKTKPVLVRTALWQPAQLQSSLLGFCARQRVSDRFAQDNISCDQHQ